MTLGRYAATTRRDAKSRGRTPALNEKALERARDMIEGQGMKVVDVATALNVSRATIYRHLGSGRTYRRRGAASGAGERLTHTV